MPDDTATHDNGNEISLNPANKVTVCKSPYAKTKQASTEWFYPTAMVMAASRIARKIKK